MVTLLYNTDNFTLGEKRNGYYLVDGKRPTLPENIVELEVIDTPMPDYDSLTQTISTEWNVDLDNSLYVRQWMVVNKTPQEIALDGWTHKDYQKRIVAPSEIVMTEIGLKFHAWFSVRGYPIERVGEQLHCYCRTIAPEHQYAVDALQGVITIEDKND